MSLAMSCVASEKEPPPIEINEDPYGMCADDHGRTICRDGEPFCDAYPDAQFPELEVCTADCETVSDCPLPETGDATVACSGEPAGCVLECGDETACPDGMECTPAGSCMWRLD